MIRPSTLEALEHVQSSEFVREDLQTLLALRDKDEVAMLHASSCALRDAACQRVVALRALIEVSSYCNNSCLYCGLNRYNSQAKRYTMTEQELLSCVEEAFSQGIKTVVLQSGEDGTSAQYIAHCISAIKQAFPIAVTLSFGERSYEDYRRWRQAGADRYLLRIESTDANLYKNLHRGRFLASRLACLQNLRELEYQVGSGIMVGLPGQSIQTIAADIQFFAEKQFDMIGIGAFIPHPQTPLAHAASAEIDLTLNTIAVTRLATRNAWMPATTALGSLERDYRLEALQAGANVIMPNFTAPKYKHQYEIYPNKHSEKESLDTLDQLAKRANLSIDLGICDSLKRPQSRLYKSLV
ncbi:MAG: [FeFe] hydrogenase H-cluster radical SAM maturase HydE [Spirochaetia bacterium]|nr:[FeFe] hydrogenase H-cluster radical SAM maturase HydE [Spirochaetia bacterium]